jgi:hypothetical protein
MRRRGQGAIDSEYAYSTDHAAAKSRARNNGEEAHGANKPAEVREHGDSSGRASRLPEKQRRKSPPRSFTPFAMNALQRNGFKACAKVPKRQATRERPPSLCVLQAYRGKSFTGVFAAARFERIRLEI